MTIRLFWAPKTRASRAVWLLEELGVDYERVHVDIRNPGSIDEPDFRRGSPMGKVPAIADGDVAMSESAAIAIYLADKYSSGVLAPTLDDPRRGSFLYWALFTPAVIEPAMSERAAKLEPNKPRNGWGSFDAMMDVLEQGVTEGPWLLGEQFTVADVMVGSSAAFMKMFGMLPERPATAAYVERCTARPAYVKAMALEAD